MFPRMHLVARCLFYATVFAALFATFFAQPAVADTAGPLPTITADDPTPLPNHIAPTDKAIGYVGRFDTRDAAGPRCSWSASSVWVKFRGEAIDLDLGESAANDEYEVELDGQPSAVLIAQSGAHVYRLYNGTGGVHTLGIVKRTEAFFGIGQIRGFDLPAGGSLLGYKLPRRKIEVIGDSISCGFGDEAKPTEQFSKTTENAYLAYGADAARAFGAQYMCVAWSGRKMWPDNTMPSIYNLALPTDKTSEWDLSTYTPDVILINLSTNDWWQGAPDEAGWTGAYEAFIAQLRQNAPKAMIYCMTSPMMSGDHRDQSISYLTKVVSDRNAAGDKRVRLLEIPTQDVKTGIGADFHPNTMTHAADAVIVEAAIQRDLGWKPAASK